MTMMIETTATRLGDGDGLRQPQTESQIPGIGTVSGVGTVSGIDQALSPEMFEPSASVSHGARNADLARDELLDEIFASTVARLPDKTALIGAKGTLTYKALDEAANQLARGLVRHGLRPGMMAGLWMARGQELLVAQLAIIKTGAAFLPFDADAPVERISECLADAGAHLIITSAAFAEKASGALPCRVVRPDDLIDLTDRRDVDARAQGATPDSPAYLIYTSGSSGKPKGIVITHRNICHFLRAAQLTYGLGADDVVFQGASVAFDLAMEEIWLPYLVGATLYVATPETLADVERLPDLLEEAGVTVIDTVPTLLTLLPRVVNSLRIVILGGEACPPSIAARWARPGRKIFNSYGPTEATVVATVGMVESGKAVTIGAPIANYSCYVVNDALELVPKGEEGELLIGGPGIAQGYFKRDALTAEKFITNPFGVWPPKLYRSGDAVVMGQDGALSFRGRIDDQVKIRGFRVELGEIEQRLATLSGVAQAAVVLRGDFGLDRLVAFVVLDAGAHQALSADARGWRASLRDQLPAYMVPSHFEIVSQLPRLAASGKIDRKALKAHGLAAPAVHDSAQEAPQNAIEEVLLLAAKAVLPPQAIAFEADFFTELGGHSLLAARFVSIVRQTPALAALTLQDMYEARTLRAMAQRLAHKTIALAAKSKRFDPPPVLRRFLCGLAQAICLPFIIALMTAQWLGVFVSYMIIADTDTGIIEAITALLGVYVCINLATIAFSIAMKWLIVGRLKAGRYPLWGFMYFRWWLMQRSLTLVHNKWFQASPFMRFYWRAMGVSIGHDALISDIEIGAPDLVSIGACSSLGAKANFANARVEGNTLILGRIDIGAHVCVGSSCVLEDDVAVGDYAELKDLTALPAGSRVGRCEIFDGSPGRLAGTVNLDAIPPYPKASLMTRTLEVFYYFLMLLIIPPLGLLPIFPAFYVFDRVDVWLGLAELDHFYYLAAMPLMAWPTAFVLVIVTVIFIVAVRWIVLPRVTEGDYPFHSWFYLRKWTVGLMTEIALETLTSLFATVYMRAWYRLMGARIGKDSEISTNLSGRYDLVDIGEKCFIADEVILGDEDIRHGMMVLRKVTIGSRVFVGNDGVVPPGAVLPDGVLIGVKSKPPENDKIRAGDTWFGSPPIALPVRQRFDGGGANWTYSPPWWKKLARGLFEAVHISLPTMLFITFGTWAVESFAPLIFTEKYLQFALVFVADSVLMALAMTLIVIGVKWLTMGRYEPVEKPMWSFWAMRTEAVAVMYWGLAGKVLLEHLCGTPFLPMLLRLFGARFGRGVFMNMTDITEFDCVNVGDFAVLNALSCLQTHLYEDRVMKVGRIHVGAGVTVGAGTTVLYDTTIGDYATLGPLTIVMKGESIPQDSRWTGSPAEPMVS